MFIDVLVIMENNNLGRFLHKCNFVLSFKGGNHMDAKRNKQSRIMYIHVLAFKAPNYFPINHGDQRYFFDIKSS